MGSLTLRLTCSPRKASRYRSAGNALDRLQRKKVHLRYVYAGWTATGGVRRRFTRAKRDCNYDILAQ